MINKNFFWKFRQKQRNSNYSNMRCWWRKQNNRHGVCKERSGTCCGVQLMGIFRAVRICSWSEIWYKVIFVKKYTHIVLLLDIFDLIWVVWHFNHSPKTQDYYYKYIFQGISTWNHRSLCIFKLLQWIFFVHLQLK